MSNYWRNDEKIPMKQTKVSIPSTNGLNYAGTAGESGRRIDFEIPPNVKFLDGKNSSLDFDIKISLPAGATPTRLQLDPHIGAQSLVKNLRIYSGSRNVLIEEISNYNTKVAMEYSYNQDDSLRKMRALKEGSTFNSIQNRSTTGTSISQMNNTLTNPYFVSAPAPAARNWNDTDFITAKVSIPLHCGVFANSHKIFPVLATQGLFLEIDMEDPAKCLKQLDTVSRNRRFNSLPVFHGIDAAGTAWGLGVATTELFLTKDNNMTTVANCPFVKGETVYLMNNDGSFVSLQTDPAGAFQMPVIADITIDATFVKLTIQSTVNLNSAPKSQAITSTNFRVFSTAIDKQILERDFNQVNAPITSYAPTWVVSNVNLVCAKVELDSRYESGMMQKMREGGKIELDILSTTNYQHSVLASNRNATLNIPVSMTRAKSGFFIPTDATRYNTAQLVGGLAERSAVDGTVVEANSVYNIESLTYDINLFTSRTGMTGCIDFLSTYQFLLGDKLVPNRAVSVSKINKGVSISAQPLIELEKSLNQARIVPRSFVDYNRNFVVSRAYALHDGVANLNNLTNQLQLHYNESTVAGVDQPPVKDKLWNCMIYHLRRIVIKGDSVSVEM